MMCTRRSLFGACVLALAGAGLSTGSASAQPASGFYLSQEIGLNVAPAVALLGNSTDRASRCDEFMVPLRDRCNFGRSSWLISQALSVTYVPGEHRLYLERSCRPPENPATADSGMARGLPVPKGLNSRRQFGPAVERRRKSRPRSTGFHGSSPCKCQRLSTLRSSWLPPSRPPTKSGAAQAAVD